MMVYNRHRFIAQPDLLAAWTAARNVVRTGGLTDGRTGEETAGRTGGQTDGAISPAA